MKPLTTIAIAIVASSAFCAPLAVETPRDRQIALGQINPIPTIFQIPVDFELVANVRFDHGVKFDRVIGAVSKAVWQAPLFGVQGLYLQQTGWTGGEINGGVAAGTGLGLAYTPARFAGGLLTFAFSGGVDAITGQKPGQYIAASVVGTIKF